MSVHLDTSVLVGALSGQRTYAADLHRLFDAGEHVRFSTIVLYEWLRGPREPREIQHQQEVFGTDSLIVFGPAEASAAARLYKQVRRARGREADIAIAACAIVHGATLWTLNPTDFADIPGLVLYDLPRG